MKISCSIVPAYIKILTIPSYFASVINANQDYVLQLLRFTSSFKNTVLIEIYHHKKLPGIKELSFSYKPHREKIIQQ